METFENTTTAGLQNSSILSDINTTDVKSSGVVRTFFDHRNNPDNIMTMDASDDALFVMECIILPILTLFGVIGNILSLIVLMRRKLRTSTGVILVALAIADLFSLVTNFIRKSKGIISQFDKTSADWFDASIFSPVYYLRLSFTRTSAWLVVLISTERMIAVLFPLKIKTYVSKFRMILSVVFIYVATFSFLIPIALQYTLGQFDNPVTKETTYFIKPSKFYFDNIDVLRVHNEIVGTIVFRYTPVVLVMLFNLIIVIALQRRTAWRKSKSTSSKHDEKQSKITRMLLIVSMVCLVCTTPGSIILLVNGYNRDFGFRGKYHNLFIVISDVNMLLEMINASCNFVIYMLFNEQFAETYRKLFCVCSFLDHFQRTSATSSNATPMSTKRTDTGSAVKGNEDQESSQMSLRQEVVPDPESNKY